jgi:hypothetical protein
MKIRKVGSGLFRAHRQTERRTEARPIVDFEILRTSQNLTFEAKLLPHETSGLILKNSTWDSHSFMSFVRISVKTATFTT